MDSLTAGGLVQEEWISALRLNLTPGLGLRGCRLLLDAFGNCSRVLQAPDGVLREVLGTARWAALHQALPDFEPTQAQIRAWLAAAPPGLAHTVLTWGDPGYPAGMAELPDPPLMLFVTHAQSDPVHLWPAALAVVGSRGGTPQGLSLTRRWAHQLADAGWCVVSGMAHGIDAAAHWGALQSDGGACVTMAVMGTGPDLVYPRAHADLKARIHARGRCVTEFLPGTPARPAHFPMRNRLVAALSSGLLVIEAGIGSGSLISAQCALEQGKEVMAVPGSVMSPQSRGCHALIRQGALLVTSVSEVLDALPKGMARDPAPKIEAQLVIEGTELAGTLLTPPRSPQLVALKAALGHDPLAVDVLQQRLTWPVAELRAQLQDLEWQGRLARLPGDRVQWVGD